MPPATLTPVFVALKIGLHVVIVGLVIVVILRAVVLPVEFRGATVAVALVLLATYGVGAVAGRRAPGSIAVRLLWLGLLTIEVFVLLWLTPDAAYLVFPLFFLFLHLLGPGWGAAATVASTATVILALAAHSGWSVGGVVGPVVGAGVALLLGLGYQALAREAREREALVHELLVTRGQLAATERESGIIAERTRLAREIHDTVAQDLSSIQLLLHAAEGADPDRAGVEHIRLARDTAAGSLAETRRFIRELTPPDLDDRGLGAALRRLAASQWSAQGLVVTVDVPDPLALPMHVQAALLRIAQSAIANVIQHAQAETASITLDTDPHRVRFTVADDGIGFSEPPTSGLTSRGSDSFGLRAIRERVSQLGGTVSVMSAPHEGTTLTVELTHERVA